MSCARVCLCEWMDVEEIHKGRERAGKRTKISVKGLKE